MVFYQEVCQVKYINEKHVLQARLSLFHNCHKIGEQFL